jgi:hypothetical protein
MISRKGFEKKLSRCNWGIIPEFAWRIWGRPQETLVRIVGVSDESKTKYLSNIDISNGFWYEWNFQMLK